jgi:hypothetical protein
MWCISPFSVAIKKKKKSQSGTLERKEVYLAHNSGG